MTRTAHCRVPGCTRGLYAKGLCLNHYQRWWQEAPVLRKVVECSSTCEVCERRIPDLPPKDWTLTDTGIVCPNCHHRQEAPVGHPKFVHFWQVVEELTGQTPQQYLYDHGAMVEDAPDIEFYDDGPDDSDQ